MKIQPANPPTAASNPAFDYPERRVKGQIRWHSDKAAWNKRRFHLAEMMTLVAGVMVPVANLIPIGDASRILAAALGAIVVIATGASKLYKFQENWLEFRATSEALTRELELYEAKAGDYEIANARDRNGLLVERVEGLVSNVTAQFVSRHRATNARVNSDSADDAPENAASEDKTKED
jgi:hypothetical protein